LAEIYNNFPNYIKQIITDSNWENEIRKIVEKNKLRIDQGAILEREVVFIMLGVDDVENFEENLKKEANINSKIAEEISNAVSMQVFEPIMAKLMTATEKVEESNFAKNEIHNELPEKKVEEVSVVSVTKEIPQKIENGTTTNKENDVIKLNFSKPNSQSPRIIDHYLEPIE